MSQPHQELSYAGGVAERPLLGAHHRRRSGPHHRPVRDREALVEVASGRRWTYTELGRAVDEVALGLLAKGVAKGDRVGIWAPNCAEWVLVQYATARIGAIIVNINPAYRVHELAYVLQQAGISLLVSATQPQDQRLPRDDRAGARREPGAARGGLPRRPRPGTGCWPPAPPSRTPGSPSAPGR